MDMFEMYNCTLEIQNQMPQSVEYWCENFSFDKENHLCQVEKLCQIGQPDLWNLTIESSTLEAIRF